ncbi:MAG: hypothetical protein COV52_06790 [Gammaproteobacteria bacterium CG11_big_fil_rev_8_21_14_0_20_46_22]|nr:MAG: hypothetical protein COW05_03725 [Gammaproteobacteria bacterium CG12_big_fil_rev_8_21_14_0_65_46_12]PIR10879.1 MAG: hypothetical protein COV52_06790 [Gammaproteobacteria bacterium CG11_big_fil_rev_8_21_14_0_20_46_22]
MDTFFSSGATTVSQSVVYVPQGKTARLSRASFEHGITGLATDGFSNCLIVVFIGENGVSMSHVDTHMALFFSEELRKERQWVGDRSVCKIIHRGEGFPKYCFNQRNLFSDVEWIDVVMPTDAVRVYRASDNMQGFEVQLAPNLNNVPLIKHPNERHFWPVYKGREMMFISRVGLEVEPLSACLSGVQFSSVHLLFGGQYWKKLPDKELELPQDLAALVAKNSSVTSGGLVSQKSNIGLRMTILRLLDHFGSVLGINVMSSETTLNAFYPAAEASARYLVWRALQYNPVALLHEEALDVAHDERSVASLVESELDLAIQSRLKALLDNPLSSFRPDNLLQLLEECRGLVARTGYIDAIITGLESCFRSYNHLVEYKRSIDQVPRWRDEIKAAFIGPLPKAFAEKRYGEAAEILARLLPLAIRAYDESDKNLSLILHNYGRALFLDGNAEKARPYLEQAYELRDRNLGHNDERTQRTNQLLEECQRQLPGPLRP